jgi:alkane 1-monooxygenase
MKYLWSYSIPLVAAAGIYQKGYALFAVVIFSFVIIPLAEILLPQNTKNLDKKEADKKSREWIYDILLYLNIPIVYGILIWSLYLTAQGNLQSYEIIGLTLSLGIVFGSNAINVAHELGHRDAWAERMLGKLLLIPTFYTHFYIEHNHGHHLDVGTPDDPSTAKYNQSLFAFWFQSVTGTYRKAWRIQSKLNKVENRAFFSFKSDMIWFTLLHFIYGGTVFTLFGESGLMLALFSAITGILLLETINYIEHYGLRRNLRPSGRYDRVAENHSWNSNHALGRIVLYELTRHSDHHFKSNKKYQLLNCHETSPQLPFGYPTSMVIAFVPPLWFHIMNPRIPKEMIPIGEN